MHLGKHKAYVQVTRRTLHVNSPFKPSIILWRAKCHSTTLSQLMWLRHHIWRLHFVCEILLKYDAYRPEEVFADLGDPAAVLGAAQPWEQMSASNLWLNYGVLLIASSFNACDDRYIHKNIHMYSSLSETAVLCVGCLSPSQWSGFWKCKLKSLYRKNAKCI